MITETSRTERVLIVLNPDGSLKGAHGERLHEVRSSDGNLIAARQTVEPYSAAALEAALPGVAALTARVLELEASEASLTSARNSLQAQADGLTSERDALTVQRDALTAERDSLRTSLDAMTAARDALQAQIDAAAQAAAQASAQAASSVTPLQASKALRAAGLLAQVQAMVAAAPEDDDVRLAWDWALTWERNSPFVATLGAALGLTDAQIDDLFAAAAAL